jgi:pimeloyl-ACP methyl ester carboxylesterase
MILKQGRLAAAGIILLVMGGLLSLLSRRGFSEKRLIADAGACRMEILVVENTDPPAGDKTGSVVLFHGISANKFVMAYIARTFAELGLRVYVPDLPGQGRSPGPFTPDRAEACAVSLVRGLSARGMIEPDHTILAGHSMGAAIALRMAPKIRPAGVVAISPAPMTTNYGLERQNLLYFGPPAILPNTLILAGQLEILGLAQNAADLAATSSDPTVKFEKVPYNSHVSVLFSPAVARTVQNWAVHVLHTPDPGKLPSRANLYGSVLGLIGILLLAGPFLIEACGKEIVDEPASPALPSRPRIVLEFTLVSLAVVYLLQFVIPLRVLHLYQGDYLASFFLLTGAALLVLHPRLALQQLRTHLEAVGGALIGGIVLLLLGTGWIDLTSTEAWLTEPRWIRFPVFALATFLFLYAIEILLGPVKDARYRTAFALLLILIAWSVLSLAVIYLHSAQFLLVLLAPYFALFFLSSRSGARLVRQHTASATAAALFGAILLSGLFLVLFPLS